MTNSALITRSSLINRWDGCGDGLAQGRDEALDFRPLRGAGRQPRQQGAGLGVGPGPVTRPGESPGQREPRLM